MRRVGFFGLRAALIAALLFGALPIPARLGETLPRATAGDEITLRDLVRKYAKDKDGKTLAKKIGFSKEVAHVVALEYAIMLQGAGHQTPVADVKTHQFKLGDRIRVRIAPVSSAYIYILHEGTSGNRVCLLPTSEERPPFVKGDDSITLPEDGYFEFAEPPGNEQLLVVATEKPVADLAGLANVVFNKPDAELTPQEKEIKQSIKAKVDQRLKSIRDRQAEATTYRGLLSDEAMRDFSGKVGQSGATDTVIEEPAAGRSASTFAMVATVRSDAQPALFVTIPLRSVALKTHRP
jgi:hypothetical protein